MEESTGGQWGNGMDSSYSVLRTSNTIMEPRPKCQTQSGKAIVVVCSVAGAFTLWLIDGGAVVRWCGAWMCAVCTRAIDKEAGDWRNRLPPVLEICKRMALQSRTLWMRQEAVLEQRIDVDK
jgi:hypothetical protein